MDTKQSWLILSVIRDWFQSKTHFVVSLRNLIFSRPILSLSVAAVCLYFMWYRMSAVRKPIIRCGKGSLRSLLLKHCPILSEEYWPTWWAVNCHVCTVFRAVFQKGIPVRYERHVLKLPDGGALPLDFGRNPSLSSNSPILLLLPGLTGHCEMNYMLQFVQDCNETGYRPVVFNQRGTAGVPLLTARLFSATNTEDLECVIEFIQSVYPEAKIVAIGISLGGIILSHYISNTGTKCSLAAAIVISTPLHPGSSKWSLENKWFNKKVYIDFLVGEMLKIVERNNKVLQTHPSVDFKRIRRINSLSEFDAVITAPVFGYESEDHYYDDACLVGKISKIKIPYIALTAEDDPFIPLHGYPVEEFDENPNTLLILTKHGGHFGFLEGYYPRGKTWMNRVNQQLLECLKLYTAREN